MTDDRRIPVRTLLQALAVVVLLPFLPLLISGRWDWRAGWVYWVASVLGFVVSRVLASRRHPDLIAERARFLAERGRRGGRRLPLRDRGDRSDPGA